MRTRCFFIAGPKRFDVRVGWNCHVTWIKSQSAITLKVRTQMIGPGKPQASRGGAKMFDGHVERADAAARKRWIEDKEMEM